MRRHQEITCEVDASQEGSSIGAIFDFDGTIIYGYSAVAMIREQLRRGDLNTRDAVEVLRMLTGLGLGNLSVSGLLVVLSQLLRGISEQSYIELGEDLFRNRIARLIYPEARALIDAHRRKGHTMAIVSSATTYQLAPAARELGIDHILCTRLEVEDGKFTGDIVGRPCFGREKVAAAEQLADTLGFDLAQSYCYSDSAEDVELLERIGNPRPLNPSRKLAAIAERKQWPVRRFSSRGRAGLADYARSIAATGSLLTSFAAGLPVWALTGSRRQAQNFSFSLFADTASALIGLDLRVTGEEHLWSSRPCVFIFNHQSKADVVICARLLRRDIAGVGKMEIRKIPLVGQVVEFGGAVLIDRANAASAIEAMQPLVDVMREEGKCVALAPEGTRTVTPALAPFKKGAFHLALQAGVPIVPIVIHNALDVAPKGEFVFRAATVDVDVLPPVDTSAWTPETLDAHVAEVRGMFLEALGQEDAAIAPVKRKSRQTAAGHTSDSTKPGGKSRSKSKAVSTASSRKSAK